MQNTQMFIIVAPAGEIYAVDCLDDGTITGANGPLHYTDVIPAELGNYDCDNAEGHETAAWLMSEDFAGAGATMSYTRYEPQEETVLAMQNTQQTAPVLDDTTREGSKMARLRYALSGCDEHGMPVLLDSTEAQQARAQFYAHVFVGRFHQFMRPGQGGLVEDGWYTNVAAYTADGLLVYSENVRGSEVFRPETRNRLGRLGAYCNVAPTAAELAAAIERAQAALSD